MLSVALVLVDLLDLLLDHADFKIDRIHLNARDEFLLSRAFSLGLAPISGSPLCWFRVLTWQTLLTGTGEA